MFKMAMQIIKKANKESKENKDRGSGGQKLTNCKSKAFAPIDDPQNAEFADYQEIKVAETFKTLKPGLIPRSISVILQNTLVEVCKPGDDVMLTGVLIQRWKNMPPMAGTRPQIELALLTNNIEVLNKRDF